MTTRAPPVKPMLERIDTSPKQIAEQLLSLPADYQWQYERQEKASPTTATQHPKSHRTMAPNRIAYSYPVRTSRRKTQCK